ncbi:cell wall-binding repeat-containing protein [Clostridium sp. Mt-5]|uniref:Cell wall-binding repeat-containing protein n=1 Tax=Clostridium moutaii TaxID=3240932 RepID=A0ABV4BNU3_9CLOT
MSKKSTKALASAALMSLVLTTALSAGPVKAAAGQVTRTSGTTRYATAAQVATTNWTSGSDNVVLVSGEGYADAVSASALAKKLNAPILLTTPDTLSADAQTALTTLKPKNIYVIGGTASISQSIRDGLKANYTLTELGGANRYETNAAVADELVKLGVDPSNVMVVGGQGFSDALSVAPVAAAKGQILLLASNDQASTQPVIDFIKANNSKATVVGTSNVINDTIYNALGATTRVDGGTSRFDTNLKVLAAFKDSLKTDKLYIANASAADPDNLYADALVASAVAGKYSAPLVLVDKDPSANVATSPDTTNATDNAIAYIKGNTTSSTDLQLVGGTAVVSQATQDAVNAIYNPTGNIDPEVSSISTNGLRQIKVVFNQEVDQDTAEEVSNYKLDGSSLTDDKATASLQDDNKTVLITLADAKKQSDDVDVTVKKGILTADKAQTVPEFTQSVTFSDTTAPTLTSVEARGNNKLTVEFSEPVNFGSTVTSAVNKLKINDKNLSSFGLNTTGTDGNGKTLSKIDNSATDTAGNVWSNKIELYFDSALPTGNNTLKVSTGDETTLEDAAGFPVQETTQDFNVDTLASTPVINSITASDDGTVYINFDRAMDAKTATQKAYYAINGDSTGNFTKAELKKNDTQVKISGATLNKNSNTIYIKNSVKDAYGNKVADDTYESFTLTEDTTKPAVSSIYALDDSTIRVKFNKSVDAVYAVNKSNYKLQDNSGTDITDEIVPTDSTSSYQDTNAITIPGNTSAPVDGDTTDVVDIHVPSKLTDSQYTITIKNIQDRASTPNVMDDYTTTFAGSSDVNAEVTGVYAVDDSTNLGRKITLVFNKEMDSSTLADTSNYQYVDNSGNTKVLPSNSDISVSSDNKSVTIKLPSSYTYYYGGTAGNPAITSKDNQVTAVYATGVKDTNGNVLQVGSYGGKIQAAGSGATVKANSLKVYYDGDDLKADVSFTNPIDSDTLTASDFELAGQPASSASANGSKVTLTFNNNDNDASDPTTLINKIKAQGENATLTIVGSNTKDVTGAVVSTTGVTPYFYDAAPKTIVEKTNGAVTNWIADATAKTVSVQFDTPIEPSSVKPSDFTFNVGGTTLSAKTAAVSSTDSKTVVFTFDTTNSDVISNFKASNTIKVTPKTTSQISTLEDKNNSYAYYVPSSDDLKGISITITDSGAAAQTAVNAVAAGITSFTPSTAAAGTIELPTVPAGYTISVKSTDTPAVYDANGKIQAAGASNVVYTVTDTASGKTADTILIPVSVTIG